MNLHTVRPFLLLSILIISIASCVPPKKEVITDIQLHLQDSILQEIYTLQDERKSTELYPYFKHPDPTYRYAAAMAFASIQDETALDSLAKLFNDPIQEVRTAAIYSFGQTASEKDEQLLLTGFQQQDTLGLSKESNGALLEAIGKIGSDKMLEFLSTSKPYAAKDTALLLGHARGLYRYALRQKTIPDGTKRMFDYATNEEYPTEVRVMGANYLYRAKGIELDSLQTEILALLIENEKDPRIRMTIAVALGKTKSEQALIALKSRFRGEEDYRVKANILRALQNYPYPDIQDLIFPSLRDKNPKVAGLAAQYFVDQGEPRDASVYRRQARDTSLATNVRMTLYQAANRYMPASFQDLKWLINNDLKLIWQDTLAPTYQRVAAIRGLGEFGWNYKYIIDQALRSNNPVFRTAAMEALASILRDPQFNAKFGLSKNRIRRELSVVVADVITEGDAGVRAIAAGLLSENIGLKELYENSSFLHIAKRKLSLPKETETLYAINKAIAFFDDKPQEDETPTFNHPIDWNVLSNISDESTAIIKTTKGEITIQFLPFDAPASVANFIDLSKKNFYNGKSVHRVVPNFVIQGGCPRGDGYGGLDYTIRSELAMQYYDKEGYVGMASAGKDTEGTQWFITHSPTPHLDGKYTIFAKVTKGMNVVHNIEIGDTISSVEIIP